MFCDLTINQVPDPYDIYGFGPPGSASGSEVRIRIRTKMVSNTGFFNAYWLVLGIYSRKIKLLVGINFRKSQILTGLL